MNFQEEAVKLQYELATIDLLTKPRRRISSSWNELLLMRRGQLKIKMYQELGHATPHIHVDYAGRNHVASYSIDPTHRLAGNLNSKYERVVMEWISMRRTQLIDLWRAAQLGSETRELVVNLAGDA